MSVFLNGLLRRHGVSKRIVDLGPADRGYFDSPITRIHAFDAASAALEAETAR